MPVPVEVSELESIVELESVELAPEPIVELESISSSISASEGTVPVPIPEAEPELASVPIVELESELAPEPIDVESVVDDADVDVFAIAGRAKAATTSEVQINFFIKPPMFLNQAIA